MKNSEPVLSNLPMPQVDIAGILKPQTLLLLQAQPSNPTVRALVLRETGLWVPDTAQTYDEVKSWLECNAPVAKPAPPFKVDVGLRRIESGTVGFTRAVAGFRTVELTPEMIEDAFTANDPDSFLRDCIIQEAGDNISCDDEDDDPELDGHYYVTEDGSVAFDFEFRVALREWLKKYRPELYDKL